MKNAAKSPATPTLPRRGLLIGAGAAGAAVLAASKLGGVTPGAVEAAAPAAAAAEGSAGYRLTAHVQRYYQTTKV